MPATQRVHLKDEITWTVVDGNGRVVAPVDSYLEFARQSDYSPNTVRSYAKSLALWLTHLEGRSRNWDAVQLADFGSFLQALRSGEIESGAVSLKPQRSIADTTVAARIRPVMSFYRFHAAMGVQAASFLYGQVNARPGRYLPFLEHVARRGSRRRSTIKVRVQPREIPVLEPMAANALIGAEASFSKETGD